MKSGFGGQSFPELDWVLQEKHKNDVSAGQTGFISENGVLVEYMSLESQSRCPSL